MARYADAIARNDGHWVRRTFWLSSGLNLLVALATAVPLVIYGRALIRWWAGPPAVPSQALLIWLAAWIITFSGLNNVGILLNGAGRTRGQTIYGSTTAVVSVVLGCLLVGRYGAVGVVAGMVTAFLFCNCLPAAVEPLLSVPPV